MKIEIILRHLTVSDKEKHKGQIQINIDDYLKISSGQQVCIDGVYNFLEKNTIQIDASLPNYITFDFINENILIARVSLFLHEAMNKRQIVLNPVHKKDNNIYTLNYEIKITQMRKNSDGVNQYIPFKLKRRKTPMEDDISTSIGERGNLKMLQLGKLTYSFCKRLDPLIYATKKTKSLLYWRKPQITFAFGVLLSLMVLFPKISIIIFSICLIFGKGYIINQVQKTLFKQDICKRILPPQENFNFLKESMEVYYDAFETIYEFLREDDRTKIITIVQILTKCGVLLLILQLIFSLQVLIIIGIWVILFSTSHTGKRMRKSLWPQILNMNTQVDNVIENVTKSSVGRVLNTNRSQTAQIFKQFYVYEYQRWWVGKQWVSSHYSDQNRHIVLHAKKDPPLGWAWVGSWQIQKHVETDSEGFQYTNDLNPNIYSSSKALKTIRRRKWVRVCQKISQNSPTKSSKMYESDTYSANIQPLQTNNKLVKLRSQ